MLGKLVLLVAHHLFLHKQSSTVRTSQSPLRRFGVNMRLGSQNRFCQVPFRSIWPIRPLSDLSPNLQDFPGLLAFHESTISSNKPLQYLPCGHAMLFSLFGIWELNSWKSGEQCSNYTKIFEFTDGGKASPVANPKQPRNELTMLGTWCTSVLQSWDCHLDGSHSEGCVSHGLNSSKA